MEPKLPNNKAQFFPQPFLSFCDSYNCTNVAKYFIGRPDGPLNACHKVCPQCAQSIVQSIPEELQPPEIAWSKAQIDELSAQNIALSAQNDALQAKISHKPIKGGQKNGAVPNETAQTQPDGGSNQKSDGKQQSKDAPNAETEGAKA